MEMEMTRDELNKMTKNALTEHLEQHGMKPNSKSILKRSLIDLIIKGGFNKPPPEMPNEEVSHTEPQVRHPLDKMKLRFVEFSGAEVRNCKTRAEVDALVKK